MGGIADIVLSILFSFIVVIACVAALMALSLFMLGRLFPGSRQSDEHPEKSDSGDNHTDDLKKGGSNG